MSKNKVRVVHEYDLSKKARQDLEKMFDYLLGDKEGSWYVVDEDEMVISRYIKKKDAEENAELLNTFEASEHGIDLKSIEELLASVEEMVGPHEED